MATTFDRAVVNPELMLDTRHSNAAAYTRLRQTLGARIGLDLSARIDIFEHESRSDLAGADLARGIPS